MIILFLIGSLIGSVFIVFGEILPKENRQILFQDVNFLGNPKIDNLACELEDSKFTNATWCGECYSQGSPREYSFESLSKSFTCDRHLADPEHSNSVQRSMFEAYKDCDPNGLKMPCFLVPDIYQDCNQPQFASIKDFKQPEENSTDSNHRLPCKEEICIVGKRFCN